MNGRVGEHLRRNVYGLVAIFIALGGSAVAAQQAAKNSVTSKSIKDGQVKNKDLAVASVDSSKIADNSITGADVDESTLQGLGGGGGASGAPSGPAGGDLAGTYPNPTIAANAVTAAKVLDETLGTADINDATLAFTPGVTNDVTGTLGDAQLNQNSVGSTEVLPNSLTSSDINESGLSFTGGDLTGNMGNAQLAADAVDNAAMADNAVGSAEMADNAVGNAELADNAVGSAEVTPASIGEFDLAMGHGTGIVDVNETVNAGACSTAQANAGGLAAGNAPIGSHTFAFTARVNGGAVNPGWVPEGVTTTTLNEGRVRICNSTGASGNPPSLVFAYFTLAP